MAHTSKEGAMSTIIIFILTDVLEFFIALSFVLWYIFDKNHHYILQYLEAFLMERQDLEYSVRLPT